MPHDVYIRASQNCQAKLETLFDRVVIPREAPGKLDHGDIDFLVQGTKSTAADGDIWVLIKNALDAELSLDRGSGYSFAIAHPEIPNAHVQVDVEISPGNDTPAGASLFEWTLFMKSDSDLLQILGISHRATGLLCNHRGLHVRIPEIEPYHKKKALVYLTQDPDVAMSFYGLDTAQYHTGFATENALFDWATSGRFFDAAVFAVRMDKSNDRQRYAKRPMYRRFVDEYMPAHQDKGVPSPWTRELVLREALDAFGKHDEYDALMAEHCLKEADEQLWSRVRAALPCAGNSLALTMKGLRRWVVFCEGVPRIADEPSLAEEYPVWASHVTAETHDEVLRWVEVHWEEIKKLEKARASASKEAAKSCAVTVPSGAVDLAS
jgi:hypothetical protein